MEEASTDTFEDLSERIVDLHAHLQMLQNRLRDGIRRFEALRPSHVALQQDLDHALACMRAVRPDAVRPDAARPDAVSVAAKQDGHDFAASFGANDMLRRNRNLDDASAEASAAALQVNHRSKLKPLAVAVVLAR